MINKDSNKVLVDGNHISTYIERRRAIGLDLMRISLALLVFMFHSRIHVLHCSYGVLNSFVDMGAIAMTGFFLLSGYVINMTYVSMDMSKTEEIKRFYLKRLISIIPLYFVWAFFWVIAHIIVSGKSAAIEELILCCIGSMGQSKGRTIEPHQYRIVVQVFTIIIAVALHHHILTLTITMLFDYSAAFIMQDRDTILIIHTLPDFHKSFSQNGFFCI